MVILFYLVEQLNYNVTRYLYFHWPLVTFSD